jgi:hypothetical protein
LWKLFKEACEDLFPRFFSCRYRDNSLWLNTI